MSLATWTTGNVGSVLRVGHCWLVACVDLVSTLGSMSIWLCSASDMTRLNDERRTGPGWKHSRQKPPHGAVVGQY